jgi:hypothetical protein
MEGLSIPKPTDLQLFGDITKVQDLIMSTSKAWDFDKIHDIYLTATLSELRSIAKTPLFHSVHDDTLVWKLEHDGNYFVRSAYKYCMNLQVYITCSALQVAGSIFGE